MKKLFLLTVLLLSTPAMADGIKFFKGNFDEALVKAGKENKLLFVDVMTEWCGPCKQMDADVFPRKDVGDFYNKHFVALKLDAEDSEMNGPALSEKYNVSGFPTFLYIQLDGTLKHSSAGGMTSDAFITLGKVALGNEDVLEKFNALEKKFKDGDRDPKFLRSYFLEAMKVSGSMNHLSPEQQQKFFNGLMQEIRLYLESRKPADLANAEDLELIKMPAVQMFAAGGLIARDQPIVEYFINNFDKVTKDIPENDLATFLMHMNYYGVQNSSAQGDKDRYLRYVEDVTGSLAKAYAFDDSGIDIPKWLRAFGDMNYALSKKDYDTYLKRAWDYVELSKGHLKAVDLLRVGRTLEKVEGGENYLEGSLKFIQKAYDEDYNLYVSSDYGRILAKIGKKELARKYYAETLKEADKMGGERGRKIHERFTKEMKELGL